MPLDLMVPRKADTVCAKNSMYAQNGGYMQDTSNYEWLVQVYQVWIDNSSVNNLTD